MASSSSASLPLPSSKIPRSTASLSISATTPTPLIFPDAVHACLCSLLKWRDLLSLSETSKAVKDDYDGMLTEADFYWCKKGRVSTLLAFLRRQRNLRKVAIWSTELFPPLLAPISSGKFGLLRDLSLQHRIPVTSLSALAGLIAEGALPILKEFYMCRGQEKGAVPAIMAGFQAGGCPLLETLDVPYPFIDGFIDEEGYLEQEDVEQTERDLEAVVNALLLWGLNQACNVCVVTDGL